MNDRRHLAIGVLMVAFLGVAALTTTSSGGGRTAATATTGAPAAPAPPTTAEPGVPDAAFTIGTVDVAAFGTEAELPAATRTDVQSLLDRYLETAVVLPLASGQPVGGLAMIFSGTALDRMNGPDRAALTDEGLPRVAAVKVSGATADLTPLVGPDGVALVAASIKVVVTGALNGAPLTVERTGEFLLGPDGDGWRVTGYDVKVTRDSAGSVTTTTFTSTPTSTSSTVRR